jgi:hypothetical protein
LFNTWGRAQEAPAAASSSEETASAVRDLQDQVRQLRGLVEDMRAETAQSPATRCRVGPASYARVARPAGVPAAASSETAVVQSALAESAAKSGVPENGSGTAATASSPLEERVQKLEESTSLIGSKIDEQYQTKVETASKYRARLHGIILMNAFRNVGGSDNLDFPNYSQAMPVGSPQATLGATLALIGGPKSLARTLAAQGLRRRSARSCRDSMQNRLLA